MARTHERTNSTRSNKCKNGQVKISQQQQQQFCSFAAIHSLSQWFISIAKFVAQKLHLTVRLWVSGFVSLLKEDQKILPTSVCQRSAQWVREEFPNCCLMRIMMHECDPDAKRRFITLTIESYVGLWTPQKKRSTKLRFNHMYQVFFPFAWPDGCGLGILPCLGAISVEDGTSVQRLVACSRRLVSLNGGEKWGNILKISEIFRFGNDMSWFIIRKNAQEINQGFCLIFLCSKPCPCHKILRVFRICSGCHQGSLWHFPDHITSFFLTRHALVGFRML